MKQIAVVFRVFLMAAVFVSLAACSGGTFVDPGHEAAGGISGGDGGGYYYGGSGGSGGGGGGSKPSKLSDSASYDQAVDKVDAIIDYCGTHPGDVNDIIYESAWGVKMSILSFESNWNTVRGPYIEGINTLIDKLE